MYKYIYRERDIDIDIDICIYIYIFRGRVHIEELAKIGSKGGNQLLKIELHTFLSFSQFGNIV